jgi:hypothetical protein
MLTTELVILAMFAIAGMTTTCALIRARTARGPRVPAVVTALPALVPVSPRPGHIPGRLRL